METSVLKTIIKFTTEGSDKVKSVTQILSDEQQKLQKVVKTTTKEHKDGSKTVVKSVNNIISRKKALARQMVQEINLAKQRNKILAEEAKVIAKQALDKRLAIRKSEVKSQQLLNGGAQRLLDKTKASYNEDLKQENLNKKKIETAKALEKKMGDVRNGMMSWGFSMLFTGMAIQKFFGGIARSLINTFQISQGQTAAFNQMVSRLSGAWEYLKWSIMSALEEAGVIDWVTGKIMQLINWVQQLSPEAKRNIGIAILYFIMLGTAMMIAGQVLLFLIPWVALLGGKFATMAVTLGRLKAIGAFFLNWIIPLLIIYAVVKSLIAVWDNLKAAWLMNIDQIKLHLESWLLSMVSASAEMGYNFKLLGLQIKKWLIDAFDAVMVKAVDAANTAIDAWNMIVPKAMEIKTKLEYEDVGTDGIQAEISALMAEYNPLFSDIAKRQTEIYDESKAIREAQDLNKMDAWENFKSEWGFGSDRDTINSIQPDFGSGSFGGNGSTGSWGSGAKIDKIEVNLTQQPGEDSEAFYKRLIEEFQTNTQILGGSTGAGLQ